MKITITRSFSKKVQLKQFEPIDSFCAATAEHEEGTISLASLSKKLDEFCRIEVEKTLAILRPALKPVVGKSRAEKKDISKTEAELELGDTE